MPPPQAPPPDTLTHLDFQIQNTTRLSLEEVYLRAKVAALVHTLGTVQETLDAARLNQDAGFIAMMLYTMRTIRDTIGLPYADQVMARLAFTGWNFAPWSALLRANGHENSIRLAVSIFGQRAKYPDREKLAAEVAQVWETLRLDTQGRREDSRLIAEIRAGYARLDSQAEQERRALVRRVAGAGVEPLPPRLSNIAVIPTELCPNNCRFCLAAWKPTLEERGQRDATRLAIAQVADFASAHNLVITVTGGEPFLELDRLIELIRAARTPVEITTSGVWATDPAAAGSILRRLEESVQQARRSHRSFALMLQLSVDAFHQEIALTPGGRLQEAIPIARIARIIHTAQTQCPHIYLSLLLKYTRYDDPVVRLLARLRERGLRGTLVRKRFDPRITVPVADAEGHIVALPALQKAYLRLENAHSAARPIFLMYSQVEAIGKARSLAAYEFPVDRGRIQRFLSGWTEERFPLKTLEVANDGHVYPEAYAIFNWSLGNIRTTSLDEICRLAGHDPLFTTLARTPLRIVKHAQALDPGVVETAIQQASSPPALLYALLSDSERRLAITRRIVRGDARFSGLSGFPGGGALPAEG